MQQSMKETFDIAVSFTAVARTTTANGTAVDLQPYNACTFVFLPVSWTDGTHTFKLQDSPDNSTWTDVAASLLDGVAPAVSSSGTAAVITRVGYIGQQRYVRAVCTITGSPATGAVVGVHAIRGMPRKFPK